MSSSASTPTPSERTAPAERFELPSCRASTSGSIAGNLSEQRSGRRKNTMKFYVITRSDLPSGARGAQSIHAAVQFQYEHPVEAATWHRDSNNLVWLEAPSEGALRALAARALRDGIPVSVFQEPDFDNAVTAIALGSGAARMVSSLPLALRPPKAA